MTRSEERALEGDPSQLNHVQERVHQDIGTDVEGVPAEEDLDVADAKERLDLDPAEQKNATDPDAPEPT